MEKDGTKSYLCVFRPEPCPVRGQFKLAPESLAPFCAVCPKPKGSDSRWELALPILNQLVASVSQTLSQEREERLQLVRTIIDQQKTFTEALVMKLGSDMEKRLEMIVEKLQPGPSFFEQLLLNPELFDRAKAFFTGGSQGHEEG